VAFRNHLPSSTRFAVDEFTLNYAGAQDLILSSLPLDHSEHLTWEGLTQLEGQGWKRYPGSRIIRLTGLPHAAAVGDKVTVRYANDGRSVSAGDPLPINYGANGWRYLFTTLTDATDYSAPDLDDTSWNVGRAAFGDTNQSGGTMPHPATNYTWPPGTRWPIHTRMWARRRLNPQPGKTITVNVKIDNFVTVWWNGSQLFTGSYSGPGPNTIPPQPGNIVSGVVPSSLVRDTNILAIKADDDNATGADWSYLDVEVTAT
jgi:hypothetical protein